MVSRNFNSRCQVSKLYFSLYSLFYLHFFPSHQVDLIDMQSRPDRSFKFVMVYQDHHSKFCRLRPLKNKTAVEVAYNLVDIFCEMGAPLILHKDNGREFANSVSS